MWTDKQAQLQIKELALLRHDNPGGMTFPSATFDQLDRAFRAACQLHRQALRQLNKYNTYTYGIWIAATSNALKARRLALAKARAQADP